MKHNHSHLLFALLLLCFSLLMSCGSDETLDEQDLVETPPLEVLSEDYEVYVSDAGKFSEPPWQILRFDHNGQNGEVFISEELGWPQDIVFLENHGEVLISNLNTGQINRHNSSSGDFIGVFANDIGGPTRMKLGTDGLLYVLQWSGNGKVLRYNVDGTFHDEFTNEGVPQSIGMDWNENGHLFVSSFQDKSITEFDTEGQKVGVFINRGLNGPTNLLFRSDGTLLVNDWGAGTLAQFDNSGEFMENIAIGLSEVEGIAVLPDGGILVGHGKGSAIKYISDNGEEVANFVESRSTNLIKPNAVVIRKKD